MTAPPQSAPPGWQPPAPPPGWQPPASQVAWQDPARTGSLGAWGWGSTGMTVIAAILLGGLVQLVFYYLNKHFGDNASREVNTAIGILVVFYAIVGAVVVQRVTAGRVRLFWTHGKPLEGVLIGIGVGTGLGLAALAINSAIAGHLQTDPWAQMMTSEGDAPHIMAAVLLSMIAAPLVEETLFRGLFAESLRGKGLATAIWFSGLAFALWHWRLGELRYYSLMGALFAVLYFKRGLVCSMTTHACFNGVLTIVAIFIALHPGKTFTVEGVSVTAPRGWHEASASEGVPPGMLGLDGPTDSAFGLMAMSLPAGKQPSLSDPSVISKIQSSLGPASGYGGTFDTNNIHTMDLPAGHALDIPMLVKGYHGEEVFIEGQGKFIVVFFHSGGSVKAEQDFQKMLQSLRVT
jgi:membrane protease YdiL (CAAX protease family)